MAVKHRTRVMLERIKRMKESIKHKIDSRQDANREIVSLISAIVEEYPDLRFGQILCMLDLDKDRFNEESVDTLEVIKTLTNPF